MAEASGPETHSRPISESPPLTLSRAITFVVGCGLGGGLFGLLIGILLGIALPDYIRFLRDLIFRHSPRPPALHDPLQLAAGLGLVQGLLIGVGVGVILCVLLGWLEARRLR